MRKVRIATTSQQNHRGPTVEHNRRWMREVLAQTGAEQPDIIVLPETFVSRGCVREQASDVAEPLNDSPTLAIAKQAAQKYHSYVICPLLIQYEDRVMNDAFLIDRDGKISDVYHKVHPVVWGADWKSCEAGVTPGSDFPVFETDFGKVGIQICFDLMYADGWQALADAGAELVFWCSAYDGGKHLGIPAWQHHYHIVSAVQSRHAKFIDVMGDALAQTGWHDPVLAYDIDLDIGIFHTDFNGPVIPALRKAYGPAITIKSWHEEGLFTLTTNRADLSVADVVVAHNLDPLNAYLSRCQELQTALNRGEETTLQNPPPYGEDHIQYG